MDGDPAEKTYPLVVRDRVPPVCNACASELLQLEAWRERGGGRADRCGCAARSATCAPIRDLDAGEAAQVDDALSQARLEMVALYEAVVRNNLALRGGPAGEGAGARPDRPGRLRPAAGGEWPRERADTIASLPGDPMTATEDPLQCRSPSDHDCHAGHVRVATAPRSPLPRSAPSRT